MRLHEQRKFQQSEFELRNTLASLKSEEEKTKLKTEMKLSREKLGAIRRESEDLRRKYGQVDRDESRDTERFEVCGRDVAGTARCTPKGDVGIIETIRLKLKV